MLIEQALVKPDRVAALNRGQLSAPNNIYAASDGWILVQVVGQPIFKRWARLMQLESWLDDPRFSDDTTRGENWQVLDQRMADWCKERTREQALAVLEQARIPAYPVNTIQQALDDPHVQAMGFLQPTDYPGLPEPAPLVQTPFRLSATPCRSPTRAPLIGEHTEQILRELHYSTAQIEALRHKQVI
jgi:crotonobetainyl-CoA:carnitine CoA-transferase CaiB-like acyl-CoA transferase